MKRADLLHCADCDVNRFKALLHREQLPASVIGPDYTINAAFELRLLLDLIGGESDADVLGGLPPSVASSMIGNIVGRFPWHPLNSSLTGPQLFGGVVVFEDPGDGEDGSAMRSTAWFAGEIDKLPGWIADESAKNLKDYDRPLHVVRVFVANASRAAAFVRQRAPEKRLPEGDDFSEVK